MSKLFRLMIAAGLIGVMLGALHGALVWAANPPEPTYGTATVDGNYSEWNLTNDWFADVWRAGDPNKSNPVLEGKLYLRYDCSTEVMYALVLTVDGVPALVESANTWITIDGINNKVTFIAFEWIERNYDGDYTHAKGWEAAFSLPPGSYKIIAHTNVYDDEASQTSSTDRKTDRDGIDLVIDCTGTECDVAGAGDLSYPDGKVQWNITNNSSYSALVVESIDLTWPDDNGDLTNVALDSADIYTVQEADPVWIQSGWAGTETHRTIEVGSTETLELTFVNPANNDPVFDDPYSIIVVFEGQDCKVQITSGRATAVTLSSFDAKSSAGGPVSPLWLGLAGLTVLAAGSLAWAKRRAS